MKCSMDSIRLSIWQVILLYRLLVIYLYRKDKTVANEVKPSVILEINGLRILITRSSPDLEGFNDGLGVHIIDFKNATVEEVESNCGIYDVCILLNHVGALADDEQANELDGVDIILSAHDHKLYQSKSNKRDRDE